MKIGYFSTLFPYPGSFKDSGIANRYMVGGAEVAAYNLAQNVARLGYEVNIFTSSIDSKNHIEQADGVKVFRYGTNFKIEKAFFSAGLYTGSITHGMDLVHLHFTTPPGDVGAYFYSLIKRKPLIITYHGDAEENYGRMLRRTGVKLYNRFMVDRILSHAVRIISPSQYYITESRFLSKYREKTLAIPNGINLEEISLPYSKEECRKRLSIPPDDKVILFVGALKGYKSPDLLVKALPLILPKVPAARLVLVGDGPMRREIEILVKDLGVTDRVMLPGIVVGETKAMYYKSADVFALPSTMSTEVFPLVLLEASAAGLPLIVSSLGTFRCLVEDGHNGVITKSGDIVSLAETAGNLLTQPGLAEKMGMNARRKAEDYSWKRIAEVTAEFYQTVVGNSKGDGG